MKRKWLIFGISLSILLIGGIIVGPIMSKVERPKYKVISSFEGIEVRQYEPMIIAEVEVKGQRKSAISDGFRLLADYIFGNNTVRRKIAMTAPVEQQTAEKIKMTAPVQQQEQDGAWKISFVMPLKYSMQTLPKPNNDRITLKEIPEKKFFVIKFSGTNSTKHIEKHEKRLIQYISKNNIETSGSPKYAFYNPPWTLPFMRRNEIMLEIIK